MLFLFFLLPVFLLSCQKTVQTSNLPPLSKEEISGARLWERITVEENYKKYPSWPGYKGFHVGQTPHTRLHKVYISPVLRNALPIADKTAPVGSIVIKENYTADKELAAYTVMAKTEGYDPEHNNWFWVKYDPDGKVLNEGSLEFCADCHVSGNNDYLFIWPLDKAVK